MVINHLPTAMILQPIPPFHPKFSPFFVGYSVSFEFHLSWDVFNGFFFGLPRLPQSCFRDNQPTRNPPLQPLCPGDSLTDPEMRRWEDGCFFPGCLVDRTPLVDLIGGEIASWPHAKPLDFRPFTGVIITTPFVTIKGRIGGSSQDVSKWLAP